MLYTPPKGRGGQIENSQVLGLITLLNSANFLGEPVRKSQIRKQLQNTGTAQLCLRTVQKKSIEIILKSVYKFELEPFGICYIFREKSRFLSTCGICLYLQTLTKSAKSLGQQFHKITYPQNIKRLVPQIANPQSDTFAEGPLVVCDLLILFADRNLWQKVLVSDKFDDQVG
jgi:hypothetical protein